MSNILAVFTSAVSGAIGFKITGFNAIGFRATDFEATSLKATDSRLSMFKAFWLSLCLVVLLSFCSTGSTQGYSADLFPMVPGTELQILSSNFLTVIANGRIVQDRLELQNTLRPTQEVQLIFSNAQTSQVGILPAIVSFSGDDLLIPIANDATNTNTVTTTSYLSLREWLYTSKRITLTLVVP